MILRGFFVVSLKQRCLADEDERAGIVGIGRQSFAKALPCLLQEANMQKDQTLLDARLLAARIQPQRLAQRPQRRAVLKSLGRAPQHLSTRALSLGVLRIDRQRSPDGLLRAPKPLRTR